MTGRPPGPSALTALVLAGRRPGQADPLARMGGVPNKALLPVAGRPMILHVIDALRACPGVGRIVVSADPADRVLEQANCPPGVTAQPSAASPSRSAAEALEAFGAPLLVTTADNALLTRPMLEHFLTAVPPNADVAAAVARSNTVLASIPGVKRTWLRFRGGAFSGCNLFLLRTPEAMGAVRFWQRLEQRRKHPLAMAWLVGPAALLGIGLRLLSLQGAVRLLERRLGLRLSVVELPFAEAAVDIDKPADLALTETILTGRALQHSQAET